MRFGSVQSLKSELRDSFFKSASSRLTVERKGLGAFEIERPSKDLALGVAFGQRPGDFRLAVRIVRPTATARLAAQRAVRLAHGEADVAFTGRIAPLSAILRQRRRPIAPGLSVAHYQVTAGTIGAIVEHKGLLCMLSNNHVLAASNKGRIGDPILQPGPADGGNWNDHVGWLQTYVPISQAENNTVDAALGSIRSDVTVRTALSPARRLRGIRAQPAPGMRVQKVGRSSGLTAGQIRAIGIDDLPVNFGGTTCWFDDQIEIVGAGGAFSIGGDSGSLVLDRHMFAVGLLFAGSATGGLQGAGMTYANPIPAVLAALGAELQR